MKLTMNQIFGTRWHFAAANGAMGFGAGLCLCGAFVHADELNGKTLPNSAPALSSRASALVKEPWNSTSFTHGIAIIADTQEMPASRMAAIQTLHENRRKLTPDEMRGFLAETTTLAKDGSTGETNSAFAISAMANLALTMKEQGQLLENESRQEAAFLIATAADSKRHVQLRASAIVALGILKVAEARGALRELLTNSGSRDVPEIARPACLALMRIDGDRAIPDLTDILKRTGDARVFGTAAFALGQLSKPECMAALVENLARYPDSGSCDAALVDMEDVICGILIAPQAEHLAAAIQATRYLWRESQRETHIPLLRNLLSNAPLVARKAAAERLLDSASCLDFESEKRELSLVLQEIGNQPEFQEYQERIRNRLSASVVAPTTDNAVPVPTILKGGDRR